MDLAGARADCLSAFVRFKFPASTLCHLVDSRQQWVPLNASMSGCRSLAAECG